MVRVDVFFSTPRRPANRRRLLSLSTRMCLCVVCLSSSQPAVWLAGLDITDEQLEEMRGQVDNIDWEYAAKKEAEFRHDVMGHVHAFGHVCPKVSQPARSIKSRAMHPSHPSSSSSVVTATSRPTKETTVARHWLFVCGVDSLFRLPLPGPSPASCDGRA